MKATPRQNLAAVLIIAAVAAGVAVRWWAARSEAELHGPAHVSAAGGLVLVQAGPSLFVLDAKGALQDQMTLAGLGIEGVLADMQVLAGGQVLLGDMAHRRIRRCELSSRLCETLGPHDGETVRGAFKFHFDEKTQRLYIADTERHRLLVLDEKRQAIVLGGQVRFRYPNGVTGGEDGRLYVADTNHHRIVVLAPSGDILKEVQEYDAAHPQGRRGHDWPVKVARTAEGGIWVLNADGRLRDPDLVYYESDGRPGRRLVLPKGAEPEDIEVSDTHLLVADPGRMKLYVVETAGGPVQEFGDAAWQHALAALRARRAQARFMGQGAFALLLLASAAGVGLAVSVIRENDRRRRGARSGLPLKPVPASRLHGVRWFARDETALARVERILRLSYVLLPLLPVSLAVLFFLLDPGRALSSPELGMLLALLGIFCAGFALLVVFAGRLFRCRLGALGSLLCLGDHRDRVLVAPPEEVLYTPQIVSFGPISVPLRTGDGRPLYPAEVFERDIRPLLERAQPVGEINMMLYQLMHRQPMMVVTVIVLGLMTAALFVFV